MNPRDQKDHSSELPCCALRSALYTVLTALSDERQAAAGSARERSEEQPASASITLAKCRT